MRTYNQDDIKEKMELYLKSKGRDIELAKGYCNGLSSLWGFLKLNGKEDLYFEWEDKICTWDGSENLDDFFEMYISLLTILHDPSNVISTLQQENLVEQIELILDANGKFQGLQKSNFEITFCFQDEDLKKIIDHIAENYKNQLVKIHGLKHSCSLIATDDGIEFYDSNVSEKSSIVRKRTKFSSHEKVRDSVRIYNSSAALVKDLRYALHTAFNIPNERVSLGLEVFSLKGQELSDTHSDPFDIIDKEHRTSQDINYQGACGETALLIASRLGQTSTVERLLKAKADPNIPSSKGRTPILEATSRNQDKIVSILVAHSADINSQGKDGYTPIHSAASERNIKTVKFLLKRGARLDLSDSEGLTALHVALFDRNVDIFKLILSKMSLEELSLKDNEGRSVFYYVVMSNAKEFREILFDFIKENKNIPPLIYALENEDPIVFKNLLVNSTQAARNLTDNEGRSVLIRTIMEDNNENFNALIETDGIDVDFPDVDHNRPISYAIMLDKSDCLKKLLLKKANVNYADINGVTPLMLACVTGSLELTEMLLPYVQEINKTDNVGLSALTYAKLTKNKSLVSELKRHGAKEAPFDFALVLIDAVKNENEELTQQLFDYFENKNKINDIDRSSILKAAKKDNKQEIDHILSFAIEKSGKRRKLAFSQGHRVQKELTTHLVDDDTLKPLKNDGKNMVP